MLLLDGSTDANEPLSRPPRSGPMALRPWHLGFTKDSKNGCRANQISDLSAFSQSVAALQGQLEHCCLTLT